MNNTQSFNNKESEFQKLINLKNHKFYARFIPEKFANSGLDPIKKILEFNKKDLIKPIKKPTVYFQDIDQNILNSKSWAINTTKKFSTFEKLPKLQNNKNFSINNKENESNEKHQKTYISTDHISNNYYPNEGENKPSISFMNTKSKKFSFKIRKFL
jgi:hypothetical protein